MMSLILIVLKMSFREKVCRGKDWKHLDQKNQVSYLNKDSLKGENRIWATSMFNIRIKRIF